jgi:hypothetical protein
MADEMRGPRGEPTFYFTRSGDIVRRVAYQRPPFQTD